MHFTIHYIFIGSYFVRNINNCFFHILLGFFSSDYWSKQFNGFIHCHNDFQSSQPNNVLNVRKQYTSGYATTNLGTLSSSLDSQYLAYLLPMNCNTYMTENQKKTQLFGKVCWDFDSRKQAQMRIYVKDFANTPLFIFSAFFVILIYQHICSKTSHILKFLSKITGFFLARVIL